MRPGSVASASGRRANGHGAPMLGTRAGDAGRLARAVQRAGAHAGEWCHRATRPARHGVPSPCLHNLTNWVLQSSEHDAMLDSLKRRTLAMITIIAITIGALTGIGTGLAMYGAVAPRCRRVGGLWFARFGRFQLSWCMVRASRAR